jgi:hypothetical protein
VRSVIAGAVYFALVFASGCLLGAVRELWVVPLLGRTAGIALEAPLMTAAMIVSARWVLHRFGIARGFGAAVRVGVVAFLLLAVVETL